MRASVAPWALVGVSLLNIPLVYMLVATPDPDEALKGPVLFASAYAIGGAWIGGLMLEGRRLGIARALTLLAAAEAPLLYGLFLVADASAPAPAVLFYSLAAAASALGVAALGLAVAGPRAEPA